MWEQKKLIPLKHHEKGKNFTECNINLVYQSLEDGCW